MQHHTDIIVPDGVSGDWRVESFTVSAEDEKRERLRAAMQGLRPHEIVKEGSYKRLMCRNDVVMSNTPMEIYTNLPFMNQAKGDVLINGLGLGMVLGAILKKPEVTSVTVIEKSPDVIALVAPSFEDDPRVSIIEGDALTYTPPKGQSYDVVWHDIWTFITADNLPEMHKLHRKYGRKAQWQGSWCRTECEIHKKSCFSRW